LIHTNVLASGIAGYRKGWGAPYDVIRRWRENEYELLTSPHGLDELATTLANQWFSQYLTEPERQAAVKVIRSVGTVVEPNRDLVRGVATHWEDDRLLAAALAGEADFLVTGDSELLAIGSYGGASIVTVSDFVSILDAAGTD
jgi:putative PIN family toxin of toxin-antitoxin system